MPAPAIPVSRAAARRFLVQAFALEGVQTLPSVIDAVRRLEFVQEDSINVCGRIHDLILWARVREYAPRDLHETLYAHPRLAFEYDFPNLCILPIEEYPYFAPTMRSRAASTTRWHGVLTPEEAAVAERLLARIDAEGPLRTRATGSVDGHTQSGWGARISLAARVADKLYQHGHLAVARRENFERWFDRTERLLPHVAALLPPPSPDDESAFLHRKRRRARRLFRLTKTDVAVLGEDAFVRVDVEGIRRPYHALAEDADALGAADAGVAAFAARERESAVHLLAPLDPLVYDRTRNVDLWDFEYTWEVYTPAAKRRWGYYVLPILHGDRLVGRVDPKIDRKTGTLTLNALMFQPDADASALAAPLGDRLIAYARWLGASRIDLASPAKGLPVALRNRLKKQL